MLNVFNAKTHGLEDSPRLTADAQDEEEAMNHYRRVRDEIKEFVERLPEALIKTEHE